MKGEPEEAVPYARSLVQLEPVDEAVRTQLVDLLASAGRMPEAKQQCEAGLRQLRELGAELTGELTSAKQGLRAIRRPALTPSAPLT